MSFKVTPVTKRKVHYSSIIYNFSDPTSIEGNNPIPRDSTIVSVTIEIIEACVPTAGVPITFIDTTDGGALQMISPSLYTTNQVIELPKNAAGFFPKRGGDNLHIMTVGTFSQGQYVVTIGYLKSGKYDYL